MSWSSVKTVKIGNGKDNADALKTAIEGAGMKVGSWANYLMGTSAFSASLAEAQSDLVVKSLEELGLDEGACLNQIGEAAEKLGLIKCIPRIAPQLRLEYVDQPEGEWLVVFMDPIADSNGDPRMFQIGHNDRGKWLVADFGHGDYVWKKHRKFVFAILPQ